MSVSALPPGWRHAPPFRLALAFVVAMVAALFGLSGPLRDMFAPTETLVGHAEAMDGDSLRLRGQELRLKGLDAPEYRQDCRRDGMDYPCGRAARQALAAYLARGDITCTVRERDRFGRGLARCVQSDGRDLGARLVADGFAVAFGDYAAEEAQSRAARRGLWAGSFERPADWRARHPRGDDAGAP